MPPISQTIPIIGPQPILRTSHPGSHSIKQVHEPAILAVILSAGPCLSGATRLWRNFSITCPFNLFNIQSPTGWLQWFAGLQSAVYGICWFAGLQSAVSGSLLYPLGWRLHHQMTTLSYFWVPRDTLEIHWNFNACTITPQITKLVPQGLPKWPKWGQNRYLKSLKSAKSQKSKI